MIQHSYQLENVIFIIEGLKGGRSLETMMKTIDPIGDFPEIKQINPIDSDDYASLYQNVLVDLPIGIYFRKFLKEIIGSEMPSNDGGDVDSKFI